MLRLPARSRRRRQQHSIRRRRLTPQRASWELQLCFRIAGPLHVPRKLRLVELTQVLGLIENHHDKVAYATQHQAKDDLEVPKLHNAVEGIQHRIKTAHPTEATQERDQGVDLDWQKGAREPAETRTGPAWLPSLVDPGRPETSGCAAGS